MGWGGAAHLQPDSDLAFPLLRVTYDGFDLACPPMSRRFAQGLARDGHLVDARGP